VKTSREGGRFFCRANPSSFAVLLQPRHSRASGNVFFRALGTTVREMSKQGFKTRKKIQKQQYRLEERKLDPRNRVGDSLNIMQERL
jgi:hypothetical protein